jgi:hypothetical protein
MRLFLLPMIAIGLVAVDQADEPSERAMRAAFETRLAVDVRNALDFVAETAGREGVERVRAAGTDRFELRTFSKHDCVRSEAGYTCAFDVDLSVVNGSIRQTFTGRFVSGPGGLLTYVHES